MDRSKKNTPLSFPGEPSKPAQFDQLPEVRRIWDAEEQVWCYSVVDFIKILINAPGVSAGENPSRFRRVLPQWLSKCSTLLKRYQGRFAIP